MKLSVLDYADEIDIDFREQVRATGSNLHNRFGELLNQVIKKNNITVEKFAKSLNYSDKQLRIWREGKAAIPLNILVKMWQITNQDLSDLENSIEYLKVYRGQKVAVPKQLTFSIAEIAGRHCGDGCCIASTNKDYRVTLTETQSLIQNHNKQIKSIFGLEPSVEKVTKTISKSIVNSKVYYRFFTKILKIPSGKKTAIAEEPEIIKKSSLEFRKYFVRGLIDTEGSLYFDKTNRTWILEIHMINKNLISTISEVLEKTGLKYRMLTKKNSYSLRIVGKNNIKKYFMTFGTLNGKYKLEF